jgi:predicted AlkP superfamily pyrophosphatase or phosphodiesterase
VLGGYRRWAVALAAVALVGTACPSDTKEPPGPPSGAPTLEEMARRLGADVMTALVRGFHGGTSTDIALIPEPGNTVVRWSGKGLGTDAADPRTTHPTPWDYHQRVPIVFYGPGQIRSGDRPDRPVDVADLAPTLAALMGSSFRAPDGEPLREVLPRGGSRPRVIVLVAYDGGGWNLLERWPDAWPFLRRLMERGSVYTNATIGSAPAVTTAIHANMGTGAYPRTHGLSEITGRRPDGSVGDLFFEEEADPRLLASPTVADQWDAAHQNDPWVGMIGYESWHLGMMGVGARAEGGDRDVAVLWEDQPGIGGFFVNQEFYALPDYLPGQAELQERLRSLDGTDGAIDGSWRGYDLSDPKVVPATPAFVEHQGDALVGMLRREPIGDDTLTDLLFVELKPTDFGGHLWNMVAPEEAAVLRAQDRVLQELVKTLEREVGSGRWVVAVTADHGQTPRPETTGGVRVHPDILGRSVDEYFGRKLVQQVTPSGLFLDHDVLEEAGISLEDVARFVAGYRYGDGLPADVDRSRIPAKELERRVFAAALPASFLEALTEEDVAAFGAGDHPEGDLTSPVEVPL